MKLGKRVRRRGAPEVGVVVDVLESDFLSVSFPSGVSQLRQQDVVAVEASAFELFTRGEMQDSELHLARIRALLLQHAYRFDESAALSSARVEPAAHQIFVAHRVVNKLQPRMILADEVGLGKTIEAGLILKELRTQGSLHRVLIITPASLTLQWQTELATKFNEEFTVLDGDTIKILGKAGRNPWAQVDNGIVSLNLAMSPKHSENLLEAGWDLVIFDEAHRVRRTFRGGEAAANLAYRMADDLKNTVDGLLLLTATPVQLHQYELFSLIELVEPGRFEDYRAFEQSRKQLPRLNELMLALHDWPSLTSSARLKTQTELTLLLKISRSTEALSDDAQRDALLDQISDEHPMANVMVRNRKSQLDIVSQRVAHRIPVTMSEQERVMYDRVSEYIQNGYDAAKAEKNNAVGFLMVTYQRMLTSSSTAMRRSLERRADALTKRMATGIKPRSGSVDLDSLEEMEDGTAAAEQVEAAALAEVAAQGEVEELREMSRGLQKLVDSKAVALVNILHPLLEQRPEEKFVIFTQFRDTQAYLHYALEQNGWRVELFHGGLKPQEKEDAVARFRDSAQIFLSTEAGGEGRNLQFCHYLVNYDLPWNPMRVEQRIGRLDRFGQRYPVVIYNLAYEDTLEDRVLDVLDKRIGIFTESVGALDPILGEVERNIARMVMNDRALAADELAEYGQELGVRVGRAKEAERALSDFALDRASLRRDVANELLERTPLASPADLQGFVNDALERAGGTINEHRGGGVQISLSPMLASSLRVAHSAYRGSFDPKEALRLEEHDFFAVGHELIDALLALMLKPDGAISGARASSELPSGHWFEAVYRVRKAGPRPKSSLLRHLVGADLKVRAGAVAAEGLHGRAVVSEAPPWLAQAVVASSEAWASAREELYEQYAQDFEDDRRERRLQLKRLATHRESRDKEIVSQLTQWLAERADAPTAKDRKIIPATRGRLEKAQERLGRVQADLARDLDAVDVAAPSIDFEVLWAGLVVGGES